MDINLKDFNENRELFSFEKESETAIKVIKKKFDENGKETTPFELITNVHHFEDIILDNKMAIIGERKNLNTARAQLEAKARELLEREILLDGDAQDFRKALEKAFGEKVKE